MTIHMTHHYTCCRCIPQVHGSVLENLASSRHQLEVEMNSSTDNPLIFEDTPCPITGQPLPNVISAGNFHGEYPAKALDTLALYVGELGRISVARTMILIDPNRNRGLPAFCAPNPGVNSGFMCWELTAVS
jgi:histidine ammonia-lyase